MRANRPVAGLVPGGADPGVLVAGSDSALARVCGLGLELSAQPLGLADGAANAPLGALGTAGGPAEREQTLRGALLRGVGELLAAPVIGKLMDGELVHGDPSLSWPWWACRVLYCRQPSARRPYVAVHRRRHRRGTGLGWAVR